MLVVERLYVLCIHNTVKQKSRLFKWLSELRKNLERVDSHATEGSGKLYVASVVCPFCLIIRCYRVQVYACR